MLHINELGYRVQGDPLFEKATVAVNKGERVGLVGRNGSGKTTLLKLISKELQPDEGSITVPRKLRVGKVAQEAPSGQTSLIDTVLAADTERTALMAESEEATDPTRIAELHERLAAIQADSAPARAARILAGLGFNEAAQQRPCAEFSGGWRMRVALASLLFAAPDLLLLDEPTNHLDLEAALWLETFLKSYPGTLLLVSHDRGLLNRAVNRIIHLEHHRLTAYSGNYDRFERLRREHLEHQAALHAKQQAERRHIQSFVDRFRYKASKARQAQSRLKALARMEPIASVMEDRTVAFGFPAPSHLSPPILTLEDAAVGYEVGKPILSSLDLRLDMDDRVALLGANGNGKSTLSKLLAGRLKPMQGRMARSGKLKIGYFAQDQADELDLEATPLKHMERLMPLETATKLRAQLGRFGFGVDRAEVAVGKLSGGEKARLLFALMSRDAPHVLILDEPTNHLDVDSRQALIQALGAFEGAVILVSHDPHLIELTADRLWLVADGAVKPFDGDMDDYRKLLMEQRRQERSRQRGEKPKRDDVVSKKDRRRAAAEARAAVADLRRACKQAEADVERLGKERDKLEAKLADPKVYEGPTADLQKLQITLGQIKQRLSDAENRWLELQSSLEEA
ncbi:ABC-F family ATP-binding cassette domain-containing protein [Pelagibius litoralis]|uniref:Probable ATP-binding protein YheS n=1 Tax=Pelagibius litoralis TaxID=374515 RepID=A0A967EZI5_9PROT|nr:ABC-F family ATP-binding cassette domain-containing protein [Pelagibius litoralis]NIA70285.1 ABC-F family ATP-binding cassette domain-containing protein [Pelagibius litoralis]